MISVLISIGVGSAIWALILAPILQLAFKIVVGERNAFGDAYRVCFYANIAQGVVSSLAPMVLGMETSDSAIMTLLSLGLQLLVFTYLITKELGDLSKSFFIAILLTGLTWAIYTLLIATIIFGTAMAA